MSSPLESRWVALLDSSTFRRATGSTPAQKLLRSRTFRRVDLRRRRFLLARQARSSETDFDAVHTYCIMVGHMKSGGTMLGALLDAHPAMTFADELDVLEHVEAGFDRTGLAVLIDRAARREALKGRVTARRLEPYSFAVPGQYQGRSRRPRVLGESRAGIATQRLGRTPDLLDRFVSVVGPAQVKLVHVVRNPYDPIALMTIRGGRSFAAAADRYFANCAILDRLHETVPDGMILTVRYEELTRAPRRKLADVAAHLGVEPDPDWIEACAGIVHDEPARERDAVEWDPDTIAAIATRARRHSYLDGYTFDVEVAS